MTAPANQIHNERIKLLANAFDRASTATLVVGVFGPLASMAYHLPGAPDLTLSSGWIFTIFWVLAALWLHVLAHWALKHMR